MAHPHSADWTPSPVRPKNPIALVFLAAVAVVTVLGPLLALILRVPWDRFTEIATKASTLEALGLSLYAAVLSTLITLALGIPLSLWLFQSRASGWFIRLLFVLPLAMPPVVAGLALTAAIGRRSYTSGVLDALGINIAFTFNGVVASHVFITLPFIIVSADSALRQINQEIIDSALSIGMSYRRVICHVILPTILPAVGTGAGLALARSLGEFGATLTFAGSLPGETRTLPLAIYLNREVDADIAYVQAALLIFIAIIVLCLSALPAVWRKRHKHRVSRNIGLDRQRLGKLTGTTTNPVGINVNGCHVEAGSTTAVVGANGAGKTTLMKAIAGRLGGAELDFFAASGHESVDKPRVIILTQNPALPPASTVLQAITMATRDTGRAEELLNAAGLSELKSVPVPALSGGQSRQVAIVRAIAASPEVLILDEPFAGLDSSIAAHWTAYFRSTSQQRTTLLVTHNGHDISSLSDYVMSVAAGKIVSYDKTTKLTSAPSTKFLATTLGLNALVARLSQNVGANALGSGSVQISCGQLSLTVGEKRIELSDEDLKANNGENLQVLATWLPSDAWLKKGEAKETTAEENCWVGTITDISVPHPTVCDITVCTHGEQVKITVSPLDASELGLEPDDEITWGVSADKLAVTSLAAEEHKN